jgi:hypothetical protein
MFNPAQNGKPALPKPLAGLSQNRTGPFSSLATLPSSPPFLIASGQLLEFHANH